MVPWEAQSTEPATGNRPSLSALGFSLEARAPMGLLARLHVPHPLPEPPFCESSHQDPETTGVPFVGPACAQPAASNSCSTGEKGGSESSGFSQGHVAGTCTPARNPGLRPPKAQTSSLPWRFVSPPLVGNGHPWLQRSQQLSHLPSGTPFGSSGPSLQTLPGRAALATVCTHDAPPPHPEEGCWV